MSGKEKLVIIQLYDSENEDTPFLAKTKLSEEELEKVVKKIIEEFENKNFFDWSYEDLVEELKKRNFIKILQSEFYRIYA